ncbi:hypothetical protein LJC56_08830 [Christensenellaceae bacterium OttesenSCG-928-K19]|nr:hypothetical protein [Christensenellaceae bacterium OttesenSCG-928-K19]
MPYIKTTTNTPIPAEKREAIKSQLGTDASIIGKSESWLMVDFEEQRPLYFKGTADPAALVSVDLYGSAGGDAYGKMTAAVSTLLQEQLGIPQDRIFVKYSEYSTWGYNGRNF